MSPEQTILALWNADCVPPPPIKNAFRKTVFVGARPLQIARRLEQPQPLDKYLFMRRLELNHDAFACHQRRKFPAEFNLACEGNTKALIALAEASRNSAAFWKTAARWCAEIVTFPILPHPHVRPLMLPEDDTLLDWMIARRDEAKALWPRRGCERPISSIINYGDFDHAERRQFWDGIMSGVYHRTPAERQSFFDLVRFDRAKADEDFGRWEFRKGVTTWREDGLPQKMRMKLAAAQAEKINDFRAPVVKKDGGIDQLTRGHGSIRSRRNAA